MERKDAIKVIDRMLVSIAFSDQKIAIGRPEEVKEALRYALDSLKTDEMYNLLAETPPDIFENWIPCSERLPKAYEPVIRTKIENGWNGTTYKVVDLGTICPTDCHNVIAWMPLPEPYKAESEDKE